MKENFYERSLKIFATEKEIPQKIHFCGISFSVGEDFVPRNKFRFSVYKD